MITDSTCSQPHRRPRQAGGLRGVVASQVAARLAEGGPLEGGLLVVAAVLAALLMCQAVLACLQKSMAKNRESTAPNSSRMQETVCVSTSTYFLHGEHGI